MQSGKCLVWFCVELFIFLIFLRVIYSLISSRGRLTRSGQRGKEAAHVPSNTCCRPSHLLLLNFLPSDAPYLFLLFITFFPCRSHSLTRRGLKVPGVRFAVDALLRFPPSTHYPSRILILCPVFDSQRTADLLVPLTTRPLINLIPATTFHFHD